MRDNEPVWPAIMLGVSAVFLTAAAWLYYDGAESREVTRRKLSTCEETVERMDRELSRYEKRRYELPM